MPNMLNVLAVLMVIATPALGQTAGLEQSSPAAGAFSVLERPPNLFATPAQGHQRDSLRNGVLVGAGVGAMLGLAFGVSREDACTGCAGFNQPLAYGALFAAVGAGIGAGIDALFEKSSMAGSKPRRVRVLPLLSRDVRAVSGSVRF